MRFYNLFILIFFSGTYIFSQKNVTAEEFFLICDTSNQAVILDVRMYDKFANERISGAVYAGEKEVLLNLLNGYDKKSLFLIYCQRGERSKAVLKILKDKGYKNTFHLQNGFIDWKKKGFPVDKDNID